MGLLRADLQSLGNLPRETIGRRVLMHAGFGMALMALLSWWIATNFLSRPELMQLAHERTGGSLAGMIGMGLIPCPVAATWLGLSIAQRQLFETPELALWQSAPIQLWRGTIQILLRACFLAVLWAAALSSPFVLTLLASENAPLMAYALLPLVIVAATVPLMAVLLMFQIVMVRLFAGRMLRLFLTALAALASVGLSVWLLINLCAGNEGSRNLVTSTTTPAALPWTVDSGAALLASAIGSTFDGSALRTTLAWLAFACAVFWFAARLHPRALEAHRLAEPPARRHKTRWPANLAAVIRRKELAQVLQQPGALIGFLVFAVLVFALVNRQVGVGSILGNYRVPLELRHAGAMLTHWFLATVLVLYPHMGRLVLWDAAQWSLYTTSPAARSSILRGKLEAVGMLLLWPMLLVAVVGGHAVGATPRTLGLFASMALPGTLIALGVLALIGTMPWLVRPEEGGNMAQGGRGFMASMLLVIVFELAISPFVLGLYLVWRSAEHNLLTLEEVRDWTPMVIGATWLVGLAILGLGVAIGARNYRKLSLPR